VFVQVTRPAQVEALAGLARAIWLEYFTPLLGAETAAHLVQTQQSAAAITAQLAQGYRYDFVQPAGSPVGYLGVQPRPHAGQLFLSKFYLCAHARGQGHARGMLAHVEALARARTLPVIVLTVYPGNAHAIAVYERMGFRCTGHLHRNIGGWEIDDVVMEKRLAGAR